MANLTETTKQKKARRNTKILERYNELKKLMTCRETYPVIASEFSLSESTIISILFRSNYSLSPLQQDVAINVADTREVKTMPV